MINHALRGASRLHGRSVCFPCLLRISGLFHQSQSRRYVAAAQPTGVQLDHEGGGDAVGARPLKGPEASQSVLSAQNPPLPPSKPRSKKNPTEASTGESSSSDCGETPEVQKEAPEAKDAAVSAARPKGKRRAKSTSRGESRVAKDRIKRARIKASRSKKKKALQKSQKTKQMGVPFSSDLPHNSTLEEALLGGINTDLTRKGTSPKDIRAIDSSTLDIQPAEGCAQPPVPGLSYGLERVLFNPGVYHLQDPRSRVYNFDPYLQSIMPVAEFNFDALKEYITSSRDKSLRLLAKEQGKKYIGSSSSMTGALAHFHFLLSYWRNINTQRLSQGFPAKLKSFTALQRSPSAIFLRWDGDSYAIDADKEFDSANILSFLGKSMEKLLTLPTHEFERYRKSGPGKISEEEKDAPEAYHYSTIGDFLLRSQLDAHDARLPGTGMFDLKTRAVVSIRMNAGRYHNGLGYEIKGQYGEWESYEREYFDMIRAAFLKYSLQVRMGRMDGIFVAFHNVERIFGFQYVSLPEMDSTLHGTTDTTTGDLEFRLSLDLLNKILDRATAKYPEKSLRIHFETRETQTPFMYIFAEPVSEEQITEIQATNQAKVRAFEQEIFKLGAENKAEPNEHEETVEESGSEWEDIQAKVEQELQEDADSSRVPVPSEEPSTEALDSTVNGAEKRAINEMEDSHVEPRSQERDGQTTVLNETIANVQEKSLEESGDSKNDVDSEWLKEVEEQQQELVQQSEGRDLLAMTLSIRNNVDGRYVLRPENLTKQNNWKVEYSLAEVTSTTRAWSLYGACQTRRKKALDSEGRDEDAATNYYLDLMRNLSMAGRAWRKRQDKIDTESGRGKVVLD